MIVALACAEPEEPEVERVGLESPPDAGDRLHAHPVVHTIGGVSYEGYGYDYVAPGPTIRAEVGETRELVFENHLDVETSIHWHGVSAPEAMDGVQWVTAPIPPEGDFVYTIPFDRAGTFWYHPHVDTDHQVDLGLYGAIVVTDPADPPMRELVVVFDSWGEATEEDDHGLVDPGDALWTVNGQVDPVFYATGGERVRVRMINVANTAYLAITGGRVIAGDQGLHTPFEADRVVLAPGDRVEIEWDVAHSFEVTTLPYVAAGGSAWGDEVRLFSVEVDAPAVAPEPAEWPVGTDTVSADPGYTDLTYVFSGGAPGEEWLINGESFPDVTVSHAPVGAETILEVRNLSPQEHPFHLHGNPFEVLSVDGVAPAVRTIADTYNLPIHATLRARLVPDNPGDWMLHCHLLSHEEGGMMTVLRVE